MLILEIALGIVLGGILLSLLPLLVELGATIFVVVIGIAIAVLAIGFLLETPLLLGIVLIVVFAIYAHNFYEKAHADINEIMDLEKQIKERKLAGYQADKEEQKLVDLRNQYNEKNQRVKETKGLLGKIRRHRAYEKEKERRKTLGYYE
jgi:hypothetical protein